VSSALRSIARRFKRPAPVTSRSRSSRCSSAVSSSASSRSPQDNAGSEKRSAVRAPIDLKVDYKRLNTFFADYTKNISKGGTFIRTTRPLEIGTEFMFVLSLPEAVELELKGIVKWVVREADAGEDKPAGMGIQFVYADDAQRTAVEAVVAATSGGMAGTVFECSGSPIAFRQAVEIARSFGRIVQVGIFERSLEISAELATTMFAFKNLTLRGSGGQRWDMAIDFVRNGQAKTGDLITHRFPMDGIGEGFETQLDAGKSIKVMMIP